MSVMKLLFAFFTLLFSAKSTFPLKLLYSTRTEIRLLWTNKTNSGKERVLVSEDKQDAIAVDFLYTDKSIFWTDISQEKIFGCALEPVCKPKVIVSDKYAVIRPEGLAVDWIAKKLYWTDIHLHEIWVSSIDGKYRKALVWRNVSYPRAIVVDPRNGFLFWSEVGDIPRISRAGMDGSNRTELVNSFIYWPNGLTLDYKKNRVYWLDAKLKNIASVDYHGNNKRTTYTKAVNHPYALTMFNRRVYWTDWDSNSIRSCRILRKKITSTAIPLKTKMNSLMDIKVYKLERQPNVSFNPCQRENGGCSHLCLLAPEGRYSCACPYGLNLMSDMKTCEDGPQKFLLFSSRDEIRILNLNTDSKYRSTLLPIKNMSKNMVALDFDPVERMVCWADSQFLEIKCANLNGSDVRTIVKDNVRSYIEGLSIDWRSRSVYWTDARADKIEMSYLNGSVRKVIVSEDLDEPRAIVLDLKERFMYWSDWGKDPKIERAKLDGTNREILINTSIAWPNGLVLDHKEFKLYWADAMLDKLEVCDMTGANRMIITRVGIMHIYGLTLLDDSLYWSNWGSNNIGRMNKNNSTDREIILDHVTAETVKGVDLQMNYNL